VALIGALAAAPAVAADDVASKAEVCSACHGSNGTPINTATPIIWGQQSNYLYKELHDYHSGARTNATMAPIAQGVELPDLRQLADYFAAKTWPAAPENAAAASPGAIAGKIEMCKACHQPHFEGGAPAPRLAGLSYDYLLSAMNNFADGKRTNNLDMPGFMKVLTDSDREVIARYLSGL
jgi:cytochrome c553